MDRVNGELAMSRAIGDFRYKQDLTLANSQYPVICYPDVAVYERSPGMDEIMILACDGVWDVISNTEAVSYCNDIVLAGAAVSNVDTQSEETESSEESTELPKQPLKKRRLDIPNINGKAGRIDRSSSADELDLLDASKQSDITAEEVASSLIELALAEGSTDNITALVVKFLDNNTLVSNADLRI